MANNSWLGTAVAAAAAARQSPPEMSEEDQHERLRIDSRGSVNRILGRARIISRPFHTARDVIEYSDWIDETYYTTPCITPATPARNSRRNKRALRQLVRGIIALRGN